MKYIKRITLCLFLFCTLHTGLSGQTAESLFTSMPKQWLPYLDVEWRVDMINLLKNGKQAVLRNTMEGRSELKEMSDTHFLLQSTERSTIELKILPLKKDKKLICVAKTIFAPVADSKLFFFDEQWNLLDGEDYFETPNIDDFVDFSQGKNIDMLDVDLFRYKLNASDNTLTVEYVTPEYLSEADKQLAELGIIDNGVISYNWSRERFKKQTK